MVENLEWDLTEDITGTQEVCSAIAMVDILSQLLLHSLEPMSCRQTTSAGFVVVAGEFPMVMVDRMV
tara:strand:- start:2118 stop:2318 length:201 start_codon:yes stop_codon:yes gene_type:complete